MIEQLGKGLIHKPFEADAPRLLGAANVVGDFSKSSGIIPSPIKDQGISSSCTMQAFSYYFYQWTGIDLSRQDGYSRYFVPGGGGYLTSPFTIVGKDGNYSLAQHADPDPETEGNMEVLVEVPGQKRITKYNIHWWVLQDQSIDGVAWAIDRYKGVVGGVTGTNQGWTSGTDPRPPASGEPLWAHALYFYDHNIINGLKNVVAESSWANFCKYHNIKENYFASGNTFSFIAMEVKEITIMDGIFSVNYKGKIGFLDLTGRYPGGIFAANETELLELQKMFNKVVLNPDGSYNPVDITL